MIACRACGGEVVAVELMPRVIAIEGTVADWLHEPARLDSDEYELSEHVGFGCTDSGCANWYAHIGVDTTGPAPVVRGANRLADIAHDIEGGVA